MGVYIATVRKGLDLSRDEVAGILGTSRSQIKRIEDGEQNVSALQLALLADILHINGERLMQLLRSDDLTEDDARRLAHEDLAALFNKTSHP
jgi:transcriptional regulator with XRE-family HTH domain